jgi:hypothetical protein
MRLPGFRIRTLMIAVAVVAIDLAALAQAARTSRASKSHAPILDWEAAHILVGFVALWFAFRRYMRSRKCDSLE